MALLSCRPAETCSPWGNLSKLMKTQRTIPLRAGGAASRRMVPNSLPGLQNKYGPA
jgi:hypothetical protein